MKMKKVSLFLLGQIIVLIILVNPVVAQKKAVIAYYAGTLENLDSFNAANFTHIIYCFGHLEGGKLKLQGKQDTAIIRKMVSMKSQHKDLKVLLSLGGWGGCAPCSEAFSTKEGRSNFAASVKSLTDYFGSDGIDLDWEYPAIEGYPNHRYTPEDKSNFTDLVKELSTQLGKKNTITFAAGGFQKFIAESIDWQDVMPYVNYVNLMTYDLVSGNATVTGHHSALFSTSKQKESTDNCVQYLIKLGVPSEKMIIGAAFYARTWEVVSSENNGLYQNGKFKDFIGYNEFPKRISEKAGFNFYWDEVAQAPYAFNPSEKIYATFDNIRSIEEKTKYVLKHKLGGIMFWQLGDDIPRGGLVETINKTLKGK
jgi:chitinase